MMTDDTFAIFSGTCNGNQDNPKLCMIGIVRFLLFRNNIQFKCHIYDYQFHRNWITTSSSLSKK